jgi:hypothetical protein
MLKSQLNLNYLHKTIAGKRWIKVYEPKREKSLLIKVLIFVGLITIIVLVAFLLSYRYYPEYTEQLLRFARSLKEDSTSRSNQNSPFIGEPSEINQPPSMEISSSDETVVSLPSENQSIVRDDENHSNSDVATIREKQVTTESVSLPSETHDKKNVQKPEAESVVLPSEASKKPPDEIRPESVQVADANQTAPDESKQQITNAADQKQNQSAASESKTPSKKPSSEAVDLAVPTTVTVAPSPIVALLQQCETHLNAHRLTTGQGGTAFDCYQQVLVLDSENAQAKAGLKKIENRYQYWAERAIKRGNLASAQKYIDRWHEINPNSLALRKIKQRLKTIQTTQTESSKPKKPSTEKKVSMPILVQEPQTSPLEPKSPPTKHSVQPIVIKESEPPSTVSRPKLPTHKPPLRQPVITPPDSSPPDSSPIEEPSFPARCSEIFFQESLGIRPLTSEQKQFKQQYCN